MKRAVRSISPPELICTAEATILLRHLLQATDEHRNAARDLQSFILFFRKKLTTSIDEAWRDRQEILTAAEESGGMCYDGDLSKARQVVKPALNAWQGLKV